MGKNDGVQTFFDEICEKNKNDEEWSISSQIKVLRFCLDY